MAASELTTSNADWQAAAYEQFLPDDDSASDLVYEEAWAAEVERREAEIESGEAGLIPGPEAVAKLEKEFND